MEKISPEKDQRVTELKRKKSMPEPSEATVRSAKESGEDIDQTRSPKNRTILGQEIQNARVAEAIILVPTLEGLLHEKKL